MPKYIAVLFAVLPWGLMEQAQAGPLKMAALPNCGTDLASTENCPECQGEVTFEVDGYWHGLEQCLRDVRDNWTKHGPDQALDLPGNPTLADFTRDQILSEMLRESVRFRAASDPGASDAEMRSFPEMFDADLQPVAKLSGVVLTNDLGQAYNGMGQTGLGYFLYQLASQAAKGGYARAETDSAFYRSLAQGAIATVLAPVDQGGLTTEQPCAKAPDLQCAWYHSITRRDRPSDAGGTLNQMLHVLRDLGQINTLTAKLGWDEPFDLDAAVAAGLNQLFLSGGYQGPGTGPDLADFNSEGRDNAGPAWAYYGFSTQSKKGKGGYFLDNKAKNCSYHAHDVQLLQTILKRARAADIAPDARRAAAADGAALAHFRAVLSDAGVAKDLPEPIVCNPATQEKIVRFLRRDGN